MNIHLSGADHIITITRSQFRDVKYVAYDNISRLITNKNRMD